MKLPDATRRFFVGTSAIALIAVGSASIWTAVAAPAGDVKSQVEALGTGTNTGRNSTNTLKVTGVDTLPAGASLSGNVLTLQAGVVLEDWRHDGFVRLAGDGAGLRQCVVNAPENVPGEYGFYVQPGANDCFAERTTFDGPGRTTPNSPGTCFLSFEQSARTRVERCRMRYWGADVGKFGCQDFICAENDFDTPYNIPDGTPIYNSGTAYATGDYVTFTPTDGVKRIYQALQPVPAGTAPADGSSDTAFWDWLDPHVDVITVPEGVGGTIRHNLFRADPAHFIGPTQYIRWVRNTGTGPALGDQRCYGNVFADPWPGAVPLSIGYVRDWKSGTTYPLDGFAHDNASPVPVSYRSLANGNTGNALTDGTKWVESRSLGGAGPVLIAHNWIAEGSAGLLFSGLHTGAVFMGGNRLDKDDSVSAVPEWCIDIDLAEPAFGSTITGWAAPVRHGPASRFNITPSSYGSLIGDGGVRVDACVGLQIGANIVGYIREDGELRVRPGMGVSIIEVTAGTWQVNVFGSDGTPQTAELQIVCGAASVGTATGTGTGPRWGANEGSVSPAVTDSGIAPPFTPTNMTFVASDMSVVDGELVHDGTNSTGNGYSYHTDFTAFPDPSVPYIFTAVFVADADQAGTARMRLELEQDNGSWGQRVGASTHAVNPGETLTITGTYTPPAGATGFKAEFWNMGGVSGVAAKGRWTAWRVVAA